MVEKIRQQPRFATFPQAHKFQCAIDRPRRLAVARVASQRKWCVLLYGIDLRRIISNYDRGRLLAVFGVVTNEGREGRVDERIELG